LEDLKKKLEKESKNAELFQRKAKEVEEKIKNQEKERILQLKELQKKSDEAIKEALKQAENKRKLEMSELKKGNSLIELENIRLQAELKKSKQKHESYVLLEEKKNKKIEAPQQVLNSPGYLSHMQAYYNSKNKTTLAPVRPASNNNINFDNSVNGFDCSTINIARKNDAMFAGENSSNNISNSFDNNLKVFQNTKSNQFNPFDVSTHKNNSSNLYKMLLFHDMLKND
jgi:hypothetical protein